MKFSLDGNFQKLTEAEQNRRVEKNITKYKYGNNNFQFYQFFFHQKNANGHWITRN